MDAAKTWLACAFAGWALLMACMEFSYRRIDR